MIFLLLALTTSAFADIAPPMAPPRDPAAEDYDPQPPPSRLPLVVGGVGAGAVLLLGGLYVGSSRRPSA